MWLAQLSRGAANTLAIAVTSDPLEVVELVWWVGRCKSLPPR